MNLVWKFALVLSLLAALFSIYDNGQRVLRLERQVCDTVYESNERINTLAYYREHPGERVQALADNRTVLRRFHCPIEDG